MAYSQLLFILFTVLNSIVYLNAQYKGTAGPLRAALKRSFELKCEYAGEGSGEFTEWYKYNVTHDVPVSTDKPGHYIVKNKEKESTLLIKIFVTADNNVTEWYMKTNKVGYEGRKVCQFGQISIIPSPQGIQDDKGVILDSAHGSIRRTEDQPIDLTCLVEPSSSDLTGIKWEFSIDDQTFHRLPSEPTGVSNAIHIASVQKLNRGYYRCTLNGFSFTVLLRVKDRLAALWPFIGIVSVVLVLVIIILIFEKRQKSNKKTTATDDDEQDQASDPLVRTTTKTSDNDTKKRAVKA